MSRENVEIVRTGFEAFNRQDAEVAHKELRPLGNDGTFALFVLVVAGKGSGIQLSRRDAVVCTLTAGKIAQLTVLVDKPLTEPAV